MALYRQVYLDFWNDPKVAEEFSAEDRYSFLYLLTNPHTTQSGVYTLAPRQMAFELGYSTETVNAILKRFEEHHKIIKYNYDTREIAIKNWGKYNLKRGGKPVLDCVRSELSKVKDKTLIDYVMDGVVNDDIKAIFRQFSTNPEEVDKVREETTPEKPKTSKKKETVDKEVYQRIINYLNEKSGKSYRSTTKKTKHLINARLSEGFTEEDFFKVIDNKCAEWLGGKMDKFLRPDTLFSGKFEGYLNEKPTKKMKSPAKNLNKNQVKTENENNEFMSFNVGGKIFG